MKNVTLILKKEDIENLHRVKNVLKNHNNENADTEAVQEALNFYVNDVPKIVDKLNRLNNYLKAAQDENKNLKGFIENNKRTLN